VDARSAARPTARQEWAAMWQLPFTAMMGSALFSETARRVYRLELP
jgi:hypothetical protein